MKWLIISLIIIVVILAAIVVLYVMGNKLQKKQLAQKEQMFESAQPATMLIIDKKMLPMKDANLPKVVMEQAPKKYHKAKLPIVKAKVGAQIMNFICDDAIFEDVPTKGEVKAMVSGIYIVSVKSVRGKKNNNVVEDDKSKKIGFRGKLLAKQAAYQKQLNDQVSANAANKAAKKGKEKTKEQLKKDAERAKKIKDGM